MKKIILIFVLCLTLIVPAIAESPRETYESNVTLNAAKAEIAILNAGQLEAAIEYVGCCRPTPSTQRDYWCEKASEIIDIKTPKSLFFARLRKAIFVSDMTIQWSRSGGGRQDIKKIDRRIYIFNEIKSAMAKRYIELHLQKKDN